MMTVWRTDVPAYRRAVGEMTQEMAKWRNGERAKGRKGERARGISWRYQRRIQKPRVSLARGAGNIRYLISDIRYQISETTGNPSRSAARARRSSSVTKGSAEGSKFASTSAAASCNESAARS